MLLDNEIGLHLMTLDEVVPALTEIRFYIACRWTLDQRMSVMPGVRAMSVVGTAQERGEKVHGRIPAIKLPFLLDQWVNATHKGMSAIHNRDFLMQRFCWMIEDAMRAIVEQTGNASFCQLIVCCLWIIV